MVNMQSFRAQREVGEREREREREKGKKRIRRRRIGSEDGIYL